MKIKMPLMVCICRIDTTSTFKCSISAEEKLFKKVTEHLLYSTL